jgi:cell division protein FtsN
MPFSKVLSSAFLALILGGSGAFAQGLGASGIPAEFPPATYKAKQYVDSRGCVYIRAGVDGNVTWVPRVTRSRQPICGAKPTFAKAAPAPAPKPAAKPAPKTRVVQATKPAPKPVVRAKPVPQRVVRATQPAPAVVKPTVVAAPSPKRVAPARIEAPKMASACPGFGASSRYMTGSGLRCGPQADSPISYSDGSSGKIVAAPVIQAAPVRTAAPVVVSPRAVAPQTRIVPKHVYAAQIEAKQGVQVPAGYRPVWEDDRLNPRRAQQTAAGAAQMGLIWTNTVPRKLIDQRTGKDVTRYHPNVVYPYTSLAQQQRTEAFTYIKKTPVVATKSTTRKAVKPRAVVSTKSAPATQPVRATGKKYVQVGTFGVPANAQRTAARLQNSGLPVRIGRYSKGGKQYQIVMAGPFGSAQQLNAALSTARRAGFSDAFLR